MNWLVFILFALLALLLQILLQDVVFLGYVQFSFILAAFLGLTTSSRTAVWAALVLGLLTDLRGHPIPEGVTILGPAALGFVVGMYALLQLRGMLVRESIFALAVLVFVLGAFADLVTVTLLSMRGLPFLTNEPLAGFSAAGEIVRRFLKLLCTSLLALPLGLLLFKTTPIWGFTYKTRSDRHY